MAYDEDVANRIRELVASRGVSYARSLPAKG